MNSFLSYLPDNKYCPGKIKKIPKEIVQQAAEELGLPPDSSAATVAKTLLHGPGLCKVCSKPTKLISFNQGFREFCSTKCLNNDGGVKLKKEQTSLEKFGTKFPNQNKQVKEKIKGRLVDNLQDRLNEVEQLLIEQNFTIKSRGETFSDKWELECEDGHVFSSILPTWSRWNTGWKTVCPKCSKASSSQERIIASWIEDFGFEIDRRNRTIIQPLELDIYIPPLKLAVEYNGLHWHSDDKFRHRNKLDLCRDKQIKLIQIFEHQWIEKQPIVRARLKSALGLNEKISARKTKVVEVSSNIATEFFNDNHIDGVARGAKYCFGLIYDGELLMVMSVGVARFSRRAKYEILRSASKAGVTVVGGVSKLVKYILSSLDGDLLTYADLSWGDGKSYQMAGAEFLGITEPGYFWWRGNERLSRYQTQKKNLSKILKLYDENLTEWENMRREGWRQLWDCGNAIYLFKK